MHRVTSFAVCVFFAVSAQTISGGSQDGKHESKEMMLSVFPPNGIKWTEAPSSLPRGAQIAVLEGDPSRDGPFVFRAKLPDGYVIPPHIHPKVERITVISGTFNVGMGERMDRTKATAMPTGTYGFWPAGMKHFVWVKGETIIQLHGSGPWSIQYVNPDDDPRRVKQ